MPFRVLALYAGATLLCLATLALRLSLEQIIEVQRPLTIIFLFPVLATAYCRGFWLGAFTTTVSALLMAQFVIEDSSLATEYTYLGMFTVAGLLISFVCERLRRSTQELRASLQQLELAAAAAELGVLDHDLLTGRVQLSPRLRQIAGTPENASCTFDEWLENVHASDAEIVKTKISSMQTPGNSAHYELRRRLIRHDGTMIWVDVWGKTLFERGGGGLRPVRSVLVYKDVTQEVMRAKSVAEAQRYESLGRLTGGVAHNFNNILTVISVNLELAKTKEHGHSKYIDEALNASAMGARLVERLVRIARRQEHAITRLSVNKLVSDLPKLAQPLLGPGIQLDIVLKADPDCISVDVPELEGALVNFLKNAREAMPNGGRVLVSTSNRQHDKPVDWMGGNLAAGNYVEITIADTGQGMDELTLSRSVEPFFTTKLGLGTGLGLSTALGFAVQAGGMLTLASTVGHGTTVTLTLPLEPADPVGSKSSQPS